MTQWGLDTLFNPAKRHMDEEKRRLQSTREELGDASGGKRIDLESGKVHIARSTDGDTVAPGNSADSGDGDGDATADTDDAVGGASTAARREPSPAAVRAAKRRARKTS